MNFTKEEIENRKKVIRNRMCPCDDIPIKLYQFNSVLMPFEHIALDYFKNEDELELDYPVFSFENTPFQSLNKIVFSSTCPKCGRVEFWSCERIDIEALASEDMRNEGFAIEVFYNKEQIEKFSKSSKSKRVQEAFRAIYKLFS